MDSGRCEISCKLQYKHVLLLLAYKSERNKTQAQKAIDYNMGETLNMGRHVLPYTQELIEWGLIERTNPEDPSSLGHKSVITAYGLDELNGYFCKLNSISNRDPNFGF
jgi:hypothetical protein